MVRLCNWIQSDLWTWVENRSRKIKVINKNHMILSSRKFQENENIFLNLTLVFIFYRWNAWKVLFNSIKNFTLEIDQNGGQGGKESATDNFRFTKNKQPRRCFIAWRFSIKRMTVKDYSGICEKRFKLWLVCEGENYIWIHVTK